MGAIRDAIILAFQNNKFNFYEVEFARSSSESTVDQDPTSETFGQVIRGEDQSFDRLISFQPFDTNDERSGDIAIYLREGYKITDLAWVASLDEILIGDTFEILDIAYEIKKAEPIIVGDGLGGYEVAYYDCLAERKEYQ